MPVITQYVLARLIGFALGSYFLVWSARNYKAHRHLDVMNRHRSLALSTFETFVAAGKDEATKNAVLLETTRAIFAPTWSGYSGEEPAGPSDRIIEIVKTIADKKPGG